MNASSYYDIEDNIEKAEKKTLSSQDLFDFLRTEYIDNGYLYSGSWPYVSLREKGFHSDSIESLLASGLIQKRDCDELVYELTTDIRKKLLAKHSLCSVWYEKVGDGLLPSIQSEAQNAFGIDTGTHPNNAITVTTLKHINDFDTPDRMEVTCPFSIGQVIDLEYDEKSNNPSWIGYSSIRHGSGATAIGRFIVTDVVANLLSRPYMNMIELQSLSPEFNKSYPHDRTMLLFEDLVLNRMVVKLPSFDAKIQSAQMRTDGITENASGKRFEL